MAGISSFGAGGANAHIVVEGIDRRPAARSEHGPRLIVASAKTPETLRRVLERLSDSLTDDMALADVAFTLQCGREALEHRWAAVVSSIAELRERIANGGAVFEGRARRDALRAASADLHELARQWCAGAVVDWEALYDGPRQRVTLPLYPFDRKPYWFDDTVDEANAAARYYDATAAAAVAGFEEEYLSLAPLPRVEPDFSWTEAFFAPEKNPRARSTMLEAQRELRRLLFRNVDFGRAARVLDFGCGLGTDLLLLARRHPHLECVGYTISAEQASIGAQRSGSGGVAIHHRDSSAVPFPGTFDVAFGIEVAHHVENKEGLFRNLAEHLHPSGRLLLADCIAVTTAVSSAATGSYTLNVEDYARLFARHGLAIGACTDLTAQVGNFLVDPRLDDTLAAHAGRPGSLIGEVHRSWDNFGKALRAGVIRYVLIDAQPSTLSAEALLEMNLRALGETPRVRSDVNAERSVREQTAAVLQARAGDLDVDATFAELGVDSLTGLRLLDALNRQHGLSMAAEVIYDHPTIRELARYVAGKTTVPAAAAAVPAKVTSRGIAVVGLSVRFPGAPNAAALWDLLRDGRDAVTEVPRKRWDASALYSGDRERVDRTYGKWGGFVEDYDCFDPLFFRVSPREAELMDPQQRIFLEECWKAIEDAGYAPQALEGSRCGVYAGVLGNEYESLVAASGRAADAYQMLGNSPSILASRIAYLLDLRGPALSIDTACSSSLVAVDLACKAIARGDIDVALAGGVTLHLTEKPYLLMSRAGMLSPRGVCNVFDAEADGIVPGEGAGVVVLKALDRALADGDHIYGVILASGTNQDGRTNGITAPSAASQAELLKEVHRAAGIDPSSITMVEAHGTGTTLGDPIEVAALTDAFGSASAGSCALGSIKASIGHTAAASGVAGLAKLLLSFAHHEIPPSAHFATPNPRIRFDDSPFYVPTALRDWNAPLRRAALSAFGFSGTNAHLVVEEAPPRAPRELPRRPWLIHLSARTPDALDRMRVALAAALRTQPDAALGDVSFTLLTGRQRFECAVTYSVETLDELLDGLARRAPSNASIEGLDVARHFAGLNVRRMPLPAYPFARERYWCTEETPRERPFFFAADEVVAPHDAPALPVVRVPAAMRKDEYARFLIELSEWPRTFAWPSDAEAPGESALALLAFAQA
ncbi:MAG TPA: beta-ketoacyl synthase N-terminal-like domain-containing protein, partial [Thermoanaerobaculia bacterium]